MANGGVESGSRVAGETGQGEAWPDVVGVGRASSPGRHPPTPSCPERGTGSCSPGSLGAVPRERI